MDGIWENIASFLSHLHEFLLPLSFSVKGSCACWLSTGRSCHLEIVSPGTVKRCMHFLKPITFILLSATHLLVMWKNKSMLVLMDFPLLNELSHFIYETNTVHCRASGKWEKEIQRKPEVTFGITPLPILRPLAVLASVQNDASLFAWWDLPFPFSCQYKTRKRFIRITYFLGGWFVLLL